ncbi:Pr6Pr family membrane protein [Herbiconiux sp. L3-i23]|uniref:Pr6Pr family membrane protein n=1 Tax=Herbiconiux sp. L3-i23 TaxID=2905871 RepID=UPI00206F50A9|nr:Pr6Pr family membrane protein [Herbiconiux sp. L3-i23]BDI22369.1 hypothetical protein L3i23_11450 [Herbiconiux sp. L3-i23]
MALRYTIGTVRLLAAATGVVALIARFIYGLSFRSFVSVDFFGYLTVQSNMAAVVVTAVAGITALRGRHESATLSAARAAIACFLLVAGIVFALLVSQAPSVGYRIDVPWSDQILHFVLPGFVLVDWLVSPGRKRVGWRLLSLALGYPIVWGIVTIIRGEFVGWYPYFFLDPAQSGYPLTLIVYGAAALALFALVESCLIAASHVAPLGQRELPGGGYRRAALKAGWLRRRAHRSRRRVRAAARTARDSH